MRESIVSPMSNSGIETGGGAATNQQCPAKLGDFADTLASDPTVDPFDVIKGRITALPGALDCDCNIGPQRKKMLGFELPRFCGQVCGKKCIDKP